MSVFKPESAEELAECIAGLEAPVRLQGGGTRRMGHVAAEDVLDLSGISGIVDYEPGALTLIAKAGTPLAEVEALLESENQRLAFEPMDHRVLLDTDGTPTIGGTVAANVSGPRRIALGACRDFTLGVKFIDGAGRQLENGGRVMKNVTGYDLVKLMAGSWGTLGALHEVSLKVLPVPETEATLIYESVDAAKAFELMAAALGSPYEVTGAAWRHDGRVCLRLEGFEPSVRYRAEALKKKLGGAQRVEADVSKPIWMDLRDVRALAGEPELTRVSIRPSDLPDFVARSGGRSLLADWGGGLIWMAGGAEVARRFVAERGGHVTLVKGAGDLPVFQPEAAGVARLSEGLRAKFDPRGLLNPGLMRA